ncbi:Histidinol-phosphate aminotransferase [archaeon HR01]|nr:Histidinol-phosphate aminotransferase [archaeon HR01]
MPYPRDAVLALEPYAWETPSWQIARQYGLRPEEVVRMDLNTSPYTPVRWLRSLSRTLTGIRVNEYPDTSYTHLREKLSEYTNVPAQDIMVTNGADEAIEIICKTYVERGREVILSTPTYSYLRVASEIMGGRVVAVPRRPDFSDDVDGILAAVKPNTSIIFFCSPNNPTGNLLPAPSLKRVLEEFRGLVVVDEAYYEYCGQTAADLLPNHRNLAVVRTFSKAWSLAGARVGYIMAGEEVMEQLNRVRPPNSLSVISLSLAATALDHKTVVKMWVRKIVEERERVFRELKALDGVEPYPSEGNFLLMRLQSHDAEKIHTELMRRGLVLRNLSSNPQLRNCLRLTISTRRNNDRLLRRLRDLLTDR